MGLDMYLYDKKNRKELGYWRKANAVHKFFCKVNAQNLKQDNEYLESCQKVSVSIVNLKELKKICTKVLEDISLAPSLLPTCHGFFFGSSEYDEWYIEDLDTTISIIDSILSMENHEQLDIEYMGWY